MESGAPDDVPLMRLDELSPKITDFGLAHLVEAAGDTLSGVPIGTAAYMSPEQARGEIRRIGPATDVYGLGAILYQLLTGRPPFRGATDADTARQVIDDDPETPRRERRDISADLEAVTLKCLEKDPARRYRSAAALAEDLRRFLDGRPTIARPIGKVGRMARWARRDPILTTVTGLAAALLIMVSIVSAVWAARERKYGRDLRETLAKNYFDRGQDECERGDVGLGQVLMTRALEQISGDARPLEHTIRTWIAGWSQQLYSLKACCDMPAPITVAALSPDGRTVWAACWDKRLRRWDVGDGSATGPNVDLSAVVRTVVYSPDGTRLLTVDKDGCAQVRDAFTGECLVHRLCGNVVTAVWGHDGTYVVTAGNDERVCYWDAATGKARDAVLPKRGGTLVAVSPDGRRIVIGSGTDVTIHSADTGEQHGMPLTHNGLVVTVEFSRDGTEIHTADNGNMTYAYMTYAWDADTGAAIGLPLKHDGEARLATCPGGRFVLVSCSDRTARLWNLDTGQPISQLFRHKSRVQSIAVSADGQTFMTAAWDSSVRIWQAPAARPIGLPLRHGASNSVLVAIYVDGGRRILTTGWDGAIRQWHAETGESLGEPIWTGSHVHTAYYCPEGDLLLTRSLAGQVCLWELRTGRRVVDSRDHGWPKVGAAALSPDGRTLLTGDETGTLRFWDARSGAVLASQAAHAHSVAAVAIHPQGRTAWTAGGDMIREWDLARQAATGRSISVQGEVSVLMVASGGRTLLTAGEDRLVRQWDMSSGKEVGRAMPHGATVIAAALDADGRTLLTADDFGIAQLWDLETSATIGPPLRHRRRITSLAFLRDGRTVLTASLDGTARLWDLSTGRPLGPPASFGGRVLAAAVSPDGRTLLTGHEDGAARIWPWPWPEPVREPAAEVAGRIQRQTGLALSVNDVVHILDASQIRDRDTGGRATDDSRIP
jgi:WD40 repeat protein